MKMVKFIMTAAMFTAVLCSCDEIFGKDDDNDVSANDVSETPGGLTITDIPAKFNGKYATYGLLSMGDEGIVGRQTIIRKGGYYEFTYSRISNGRVTIPLWVGSSFDGWVRYSGDDTFSVAGFTVYSVGTPGEYEKKPDTMLGWAAYNKSVKFSKGNATISWNDITYNGDKDDVADPVVNVAAPAIVTGISGTLNIVLAGYYYKEVGVTFDGGRTFVKKAAISNKSFTLDLSAITPPSSALHAITGGMPSSLKYSDKSAKSASLQLYAIGDTSVVRIFQGTRSTTGTNEVGYVYVDKNVTVTGSNSGTGVKSTYNANLKKGWNSVVTTMTWSETPVTTSWTSGAAPAGMIWKGGSDYEP